MITLSTLVKFKPWIGENYEGSGFLGKKLLIIGESHYCKDEGNRNAECNKMWAHNGSRCSFNCMNESCHSMTDDLIRNEYLPYRLGLDTLPRTDANGKAINYNHLKTHLCFERNVLGHETSSHETLSFWNSVAFYNYMQHAQSGPCKSLEHNDRESYEIAFKEVIETLRPNYIVIWGTRLNKNNLLPQSEITSIKSSDNAYETPVRTFILEDGTEIPAMIVQHPCSSSGKNRTKWHALLKKFLEI